jgi:hypothetical protein
MEGVVGGIAHYMPEFVIYIIMLDEKFWFNYENFYHKALCVPDGHLNLIENKTER